MHLSDSDNSRIRVTFRHGIWHTVIEGHGPFTAEAFLLSDTDDAGVDKGDGEGKLPMFNGSDNERS